MYFHDWRGALRPTLTGLIAAFWGLGFVHIIGFALDPLILVMPFLVTARAVSHAIQMHDRYYEEFERHDWNQRKAIVAAFAELFVPTFSGVITDALGVLVIILVPVVMLQKLAITASWWILAITVSEILLNPIVYFYLRAPEPEMVILREEGWFRRFMDRLTDLTLSVSGRVVTIAIWAVIFFSSVFFIKGLTIGDPTDRAQQQALVRNGGPAVSRLPTSNPVHSTSRRHGTAHDLPPFLCHLPRGKHTRRRTSATTVQPKQHALTTQKHRGQDVQSDVYITQQTTKRTAKV